MTRNSKILCVTSIHHNNDIEFWAEVDPEAEKEDRKFKVYGTGHPLMEDVEQKYLGTCFERVFVWHIFEVL